MRPKGAQDKFPRVRRADGAFHHVHQGLRPAALLAGFSIYVGILPAHNKKARAAMAARASRRVPCSTHSCFAGLMRRTLRWSDFHAAL